MLLCSPFEVCFFHFEAANIAINANKSNRFNRYSIILASAITITLIIKYSYDKLKPKGVLLMRKDRQEIEEILKFGKQILDERPELYKLQIDEILDVLNDGTQEMISYRWGVTAYVIVNSIDNWDTEHLLTHLSSFEGPNLSFEYAGYILLNEYNINLEKLILDAEKHNCFSKIIRYVHINIRYTANQNHISEILDLLEKHSKHNKYFQFLSNYSDSVSYNNNFSSATKQIGEIVNRTQHIFICNLCRAWFKQECNSAERVIESTISTNTLWSKKTAIHYWAESIYTNRLLFSKHFQTIEELIAENEEYWLDIIPSYCEFINTATDEEKTTFPYSHALEHLQSIHNDTIKAKCKFMNKMQFMESPVSELKSILQVLFSISCEHNSNLLSYIDHYLYYNFKEETLSETLNYLLSIYNANNYKNNHHTFFDTFDLIKSKIAQHPAITTDFAITFILSDESSRIFYGLGLLLECGDISKFKTYKETLPEPWQPYSELELIRIIKTILLFSHSDVQICQLSFKLLEISTGSISEYFDCCIVEVYQNYPSTMNKTAESYLSSSMPSQSTLANTITTLHQEKCNEQKIAQKIKDLLPSAEHRMLCNKAQLKRNQNIQNIARAKSVFSSLFTNQHLKCGKRFGFITKDINGKKSYTTNAPAQIKHEMELSSLYVMDPVEFRCEQIAFLHEVTQNETNN